jgi:hypothetical protein
MKFTNPGRIFNKKIEISNPSRKKIEVSNLQITVSNKKKLKKMQFLSLSYYI